MSPDTARLIEIVDGWATAEESDWPIDRLEKLLNAAREEERARVPEGWKMVPVTPTEAMLANGREALIPVLPRSALATYGWVTGIWADMLANAPAHPANGGGSPS